MNYEQVLLVGTVAALLLILQFVWLYRARFTRRWKAALETYAVREIARERLRKVPRV